MKVFTKGCRVKGTVWRRLSFRLVGGVGAGLFALTLLSGCWVTLMQQMEEYYRALDAQIDALPSLAVRIVNEAGVTAHVELVSGITGPEMPDLDIFGNPAGMEPYLEQADFQQVSIVTGGTVTGTLKCGEVIGISVTASSGLETTDYYYSVESFGLYVSQGNVALSGIGSPPTADSFSGDILGNARFIRPTTDGVDCATQTLVICISNDDPPTGTISVE